MLIGEESIVRPGNIAIGDHAALPLEIITEDQRPGVLRPRSLIIEIASRHDTRRWGRSEQSNIPADHALSRRDLAWRWKPLGIEQSRQVHALYGQEYIAHQRRHGIRAVRYRIGVDLTLPVVAAGDLLQEIVATHVAQA